MGVFEADKPEAGSLVRKQWWSTKREIEVEGNSIGEVFKR